ncbi:MAG: sigma-54-dependent transcriptional regulator [Tenuifilaceae bacterium]
MEKGSILIVDDDEDVLTSAKLFLEQQFNVIKTENNPTNLTKVFEKDDFDVVLLDMNFSKGKTDGKEGITLLERIVELNPESVVILMTAFGDIDLAVNGIKKGAFDFILKPWKNAKLLASVSSALKYRKSKQTVKRLENTSKTLSSDLDKNYREIIGESETIKKIINTTEKVAKTEANVLLLGENGTGKELFARLIHRKSDRSNQVFISVDMGSLNENLFESEMFGHVKGSFTDAKDDKVGRFELANNGTIFLDEIGNLPYSLQSKILTALERRTINRIGSTIDIPIDVRLISATNIPIQKMVNEGKFREDLFYRINTFEIHLPPLRDRQEDIPILAEHFLKVYSAKYNKPRLKIKKSTLKLLSKHNWPGNIRELQNTVERAVVLCEKDEIVIDDFFIKNTTGNTKEDEEILNLDDMEKGLIMKALRKNNGNVTKAAKDLGLQRNALYRRLEKYGL